MTDDYPPEVTLHEQHLALLRSIVASQQELIDVLETMTEGDDEVSYRTLAERDAQGRSDDASPR